MVSKHVLPFYFYLSKVAEPVPVESCSYTLLIREGVYFYQNKHTNTTYDMIQQTHTHKPQKLGLYEY